MSKKNNYMDAINHWMLFCERDRLETRIKRLLTARNKWRKRARIAEERIDEMEDAHAQRELVRAQADFSKTELVKVSKG